MHTILTRLSLVVAFATLPACVAIDDFSKFTEGPGTDGGDVDAGDVDAGPRDGGMLDDGRVCGPEICNSLDDDCDGRVDEEPTECSFPNAVVGCVAGACEMTGCEGTFLDCTADPGCETDPASDPDYCGSCDTSCDFGERCATSSCGPPAVEDLLIFPSNRDVTVGGVGLDASDNIYMSLSFELSVDLPGGAVSGGDVSRPASAMFRLSPSYTRDWVHVVDASQRVGSTLVVTRSSGVSFFVGNTRGTAVTFDTMTSTHASLTQGFFLWTFDPAGTTRWRRNLWASAGALQAAVAHPDRLEATGFVTSLEGASGGAGSDALQLIVAESDMTPRSTLYGNSGAAESILGMAILPSGQTAYSVQFSDSIALPGSVMLAATALQGTQAALLGEGWQVVVGGAGSDLSGPVAADGDGNLYWVLYPNTEVDLGAGPLLGSGGQEAVLASYDPAGGLRWARLLGSVGIEDLEIADGDVICVGRLISSGSFLDDTLPFNGGFTDALVASFGRTDGALSYAMSWGSFGDDYVRSANRTSDGSILVSGSFGDTVLFGTESRTARADRDGFLLRVRP
jgi:hypothetical protein